MTKIEACKLLGISRSAGPAKAEQVYLKKHDELRRKLCPGNTKAERQKAQVGIAKLMMARQTFQTIATTKPPARKPVPRKTTKAKPTRTRPMPTRTRSWLKPARARPAIVNNYQKPQTLADAWNQFVQLSPFSEDVTLILLALVFLIVLIVLLVNL